MATADTVFAEGDVQRFAAAAETGPAVAVRRHPVAGGSVSVAAGKVTRIGGTGGPLFHASLWGLTAALVPYLEGLRGPPYELAEAYQRAIDEGHEVAAIEVGRTRDLTDPLDLVKENFPYLQR